MYPSVKGGSDNRSLSVQSLHVSQWNHFFGSVQSFFMCGYLLQKIQKQKTVHESRETKHYKQYKKNVLSQNSTYLPLQECE